MVSNRQRHYGWKVVQSCANSKAGVSGCSSSSGSLERSSATADRTVSGSHLPRIQFAYLLEMKIRQGPTETLHERVTHRAHG